MSKLFQQIQVGDVRLAHRVVHAPVTRFRSNDAGVPSPLSIEYYSQRASTPGTLLIAEATALNAQCQGFPNVPGISSPDQISAWKKIVDGVHAKGSYIFLQIVAVGRAADVAFYETRGFPYVSASDIALDEQAKAPRPLSTTEIGEYVQHFVDAAKNAMTAGFDGVEVHGAHGYLIDEFLQDVANTRFDEYGGSVENRVRFPLEVVDSVVKAIGARKTGVRVSPWSRFHGMAMSDPIPTFTHFVRRLRELHPDLAYLHAVEPRVDGIVTREAGVPLGQSNDFLRELWAPLPFISAGAFDRALGIEFADTKGELIAYGRLWTSNPDLPYRLLHDLPLAKPERQYYYLNGSTDPKGYIDYPFAAANVSPTAALY